MCWTRNTPYLLYASDPAEVDIPNHDTMVSPITMGGWNFCWKTRKNSVISKDLALGTGQMYLAGTGASRALRCDAKCVKVLRNARKSTRIMYFLGGRFGWDFFHNRVVIIVKYND